MDQNDIRRIPGKLRILLAMHWIRGAIYCVVLAALWYALRPLLPAIEELFGERYAVLILTILLLVVPMVLGWLGARVVNPLVRNWRNMGGVAKWEDRIVKELAPDDERSFFVVIVPWPSPEVRSMGLLTNSWHLEDGRRMASVYIPGTPDTRKGFLRIVDQADLEFTDWTFMELLQHNWSYGANSPEDLLRPGGG